MSRALTYSPSSGIYDLAMELPESIALKKRCLALAREEVEVRQSLAGGLEASRSGLPVEA
jgi:hypothetical protein